MKEKEVANTIENKVGCFCTISSTAKALSLDRHLLGRMVFDAGVTPAVGKKYWFEDMAKAICQ